MTSTNVTIQDMMRGFDHAISSDPRNSAIAISYKHNLTSLDRSLEELQRLIDRLQMHQSQIMALDQIAQRTGLYQSVLTTETLASNTRQLTRNQLAGAITAGWGEGETVRNRRQMVSTNFSNTNNQSSQFINQLAAVLKALNEMNKSVIRNLR
jgi:hypothetical protein